MKDNLAIYIKRVQIYMKIKCKGIFLQKLKLQIIYFKKLILQIVYFIYFFCAFNPVKSSKSRYLKSLLYVEIITKIHIK